VRNQIQQISVLSGSTLTSSWFGVAGAQLLGLHLPEVDSCVLYVQAAATAIAADPTSGDFARVANPAGSGDFTINTTSGSPLALALTEVLHPFTFARLEFGAAQTDTRTATLIQKV